MNGHTAVRIATERQLPLPSVQAVLTLTEEGCTVPFMARYRKEAIGSLDEEAIRGIQERHTQLEELDARRKAILSSLAERGLLTEDLERSLQSASTITALEDLYLPFRPKRKTRASVALEKGLAPLADKLLQQDSLSPEETALLFLSPEKGVLTVADALQGARDILAERVSEDREARQGMRVLFARRGTLRSSVMRGKESDGQNFRDYFDWEELAARAPSHRVLAMFRGEREKVLSLSLRPGEAEAFALLKKIFVRGETAASKLVEEAVEDGYRRLLAPAMETELRNALKKRADKEAIAVFGKNVRNVLLAPPLGPKNILALDPGFRTGCKFVCLNRQGDLLYSGVIFPHPPRADEAGSARTLLDAVEKYSVEAVAIGNGTAGRETERFVRGLGLPEEIPVLMVNESGASVYSASDTARREFPDHDITVRGTVSIGRRLLDPLAELVKIDPKSIGVGQYQHDVDQKDLRRELDAVVESCVNAVGVDVNTASPELLSFVSGIGSSMATQIVKHRETQGAFSSRKDLLKVPRLGPKTFELAAGFLRVHGGENPLDESAVHPERYDLVHRMASDLGCTVPELIADGTLRERIDIRRYVSPETGLPTLKDIMAELEKPGRDPRATFENVQFAEGVEKIGDLLPGMTLPGVVTNITSFGAFVDLGVHQDGLVHRSHLPPAGVAPGQAVEVSVLHVDLERRRISLSMKRSRKERRL